MYNSSFRSRYNCFWIPALIGAGASIAGGLTSLFGQKSNVDKQIKAQQQENALNRQFNAAEAQKNRDFQTAQINNYRQYNSPANQARLMQEAGYHPMAALGQFGSMDAGTTSGAQASSNGGISPVGFNPPDFGQSALIASQADLNKSAAEKNRAEVGKVNEEKITEALLRDGSYQSLNLDIIYKGIRNENEANDLALKVATLDTRIESFKQELTNLSQIGTNLKTQGSILKKDNLIKSLEWQFQSETYHKRVAHQAAISDISVAEANVINRRLLLEFASMESGINLSNWQAYQAKWNGNYMKNERNIHSWKFQEELRGLKLVNDKFEFDFGVNKSVAEVNAWIDTVGNGIGTLIDCFNLKNLAFGRRGGYSHSLAPTPYTTSYSR